MEQEKKWMWQENNEGSREDTTIDNHLSISAFREFEKLFSVKVRYTGIDMNGHVNAGKYFV